MIYIKQNERGYILKIILQKSSALLIALTKAQSEVIQVVRDRSYVPLVGAVGVLAARAGIQHNVVVGLIPLSRDVGESLVHGGVRNHILVVGDSVSILDDSGSVIRESSVSNSRRAVVEHSDVVDVGVDQINAHKSR